MAVTKRKDGSYRAYKKIFGVEHQFYCADELDAEKKQEELEQLAIEAIQNAPQRLFWDNGRMIGFSIAAVFRKNRKPNIVARMQLKKDGHSFRRELTHKTNQLTWAWIRREWKDFYDVSVDERIALHDKIHLAKSLYEADIYRAKMKISAKTLTGEQPPSSQQVGSERGFW